MDDLSLQVGFIHPVKVRDGEVADSGTGKIERDGRAQPPHANNQRPACGQLLLAVNPDLGEFDLPAIAFLVDGVHEFLSGDGACSQGCEGSAQYNDKLFFRQVRR